MFRAYFALAALFALLAPAGAAEPTPPVNPNPKSLEVSQQELSKARELVQRLGNEEYREREDAERELAAMGRLARAALLDGANLNPDPEIRARCTGLLPKAISLEMKARINAFLADTESKYDHDLPGWHKLRAVVRGEFKMFGWTHVARPDADKIARELFIEFMKAPGGRKLLVAVGGPPGELGQLVASRKQELYAARFGRGAPQRIPTVAEVGAVLFAESQVSARLVPRSSVITSIVTASGFTAAVQKSDAQGQALRAVMNAWFDSRTEAVDMYSALTLANNVKNEEAAGRLAIRMISTPGLQGVYKGQALTTIVRLKLTDRIPAIEKAFADATVLSTSIRIVNGKQVRQSIEVRDAALLAVLMMKGEDPGDYGFDSFPRSVTSFTYTSARLADEKRGAAFMKYGWEQLKASMGKGKP